MLSKHSACNRVSDELPMRQTRTVRFGAETEWSFRHTEEYLEFMQALEPLRDSVIAKYDGTLADDRGVEIVTKPFSLARTRGMVGRITRLATAQDLRLQPSDAVHVHVSRLGSRNAYLSLVNHPYAVYEIPEDIWGRRRLRRRRRSREIATVADRSHALSFLYARAAFMAPDAQAFWDAVACSPELSLRLRYVQPWDEAWYAVSHGGWIYDSRHGDAVSFSHLEPTVEFRAFRTTTNARTNRSYLDVVHALLAYGRTQVTGWDARTNPFTPPPFDAHAFAQFVLAQKHDYKALRWRLQHGSPANVLRMRGAR